MGFDAVKLPGPKEGSYTLKKEEIAVMPFGYGGLFNHKKLEEGGNLSWVWDEHGIWCLAWHLVSTLSSGFRACQLVSSMSSVI